MVELVAKSACAGLLPLTIGAVTLEEMEVGEMTSISPMGDAALASEILEQACGVGLPAPNRSTSNGGSRCIWFGRNEMLLMGGQVPAELSKHAAVVDQSDAWAVVSLKGAGATEVLARLVPVDLRDGEFKRGHTVRSSVQHMHGSITRLGNDHFMIIVFRSMAGTLVHDLKQAMAGVAARG